MTNLQLDQFLPYRLVVSADLVSNALSRVYAKYQVTIPEWRILAQLSTHESLTPGELGRLTKMEKARISRALILMDSKQWIERTPDRFDKRSAHINLSQAGKDLYKSIEPEVISWNHEFHKLLGEEHYKELLTALKHIEEWTQQQKI